jgi:O-antigen ligase
VLDGILPFALAFGMTAASRTRRLLCYGSAAIMVLSVILTGSRGGLLGLLAVVVFVMIEPGTLRPRQVATTKFAPARKRKMGAKARIVLSLMACVLIGVSVWPQLPPETRARLATLESLDSDYNVNDEKTGRVLIWQHGLEALAHRPIGVGINAYPMADVKYGFHTAHNSLVLVLVELGPVGFVMYLAVLLHTWRGLTKLRRTLRQLEEPSEEQRQQAIFSRMLQAGLVGNFVAGEFLSATYFYAYWANLALAMGFIALFNRAALEPTPERKIVFGR